MTLRLVALVVAEAKRTLLMRIRYPLSILGAILVIAVGYFFVGAVRQMLGLGAVGDLGAGNNWALIASVCVWISIVSGIGRVTRYLGTDFSTGLVELYLISSIPVWLSLLVRYTVSSVYPLTVIAMALWGASKLASSDGPSFGVMLSGLVLLDMALIGLSFAASGLALAFKQMAGVLSALYIVSLLAVIFVATGQTGGEAMALAPILGPAQAVIDGSVQWTAANWCAMSLVSFVSAALGVGLFQFLKRHTLRAGTIFLN